MITARGDVGRVVNIADTADEHAIIAQTDANGVITYVNDRFIKISGYTREELIGKKHSILNSGYHPSQFFERMWQCITSGKTWVGTVKNKAKDGSFYWVHTTIKPIVGSDGRVTGYTSLRTDITQVVQLRKDRKSLARRASYRAHLDRVFDLEREHKTLPELLGSALEILFKVKTLPLLSAGKVLLAGPEEKDLDLSCLYNPEILDLGFANDFCVPIMVGTERIGDLVLYVSEDGDCDDEINKFLREFAHALGILIGFKRREEELVCKEREALEVAEIARNAMIEAQKAEQAKSDFLSTMSHELRTPMNGMVGMLHVLKMGELSEDQCESVDVALSSSDLLLAIIDNVLDTAKLEHGAMALERLPVNLNDFVHNTLAALLPLANEKQLRLEAIIAPDLPESIFGDPVRLKQILNNFISNAIKFTTRGSVKISVESIHETQDVTASDWLSLKVTDTGIGLSAEQAEIIFDRFTQADNSISRHYGGTGLGLAICKQLAEIMGGSIGVKSAQGKGSTFWIKIPLNPVCIDLQKTA
jgi:PAS domain S-box-containing protein